MWISPWFALGAIGVMAFGLYLWRLAWRHVQLRRAMRRWPRVPAQVVGYRTAFGARSRRVDVKLRYLYDGRNFEVWSGSPTRSGYGRGDVQAQRQVAARFPRGSSQQAFVNPSTPEQAFLELPESHMLAMLVGMGLLLVTLPVALASPVVFGIDEEIVKLSFMLVLAAVLAVIAVFAAIALWRTPRPRR